MKRCSILLLSMLSASTYATNNGLSPNYRDYFTVNFENVAPQAQKISSQGSLTVEDLHCANNQCTFDLYGGNGENDTGVATLFFGDRLAGFCGVVIPDGSKTTTLKMYPVCLDAKASPLNQTANSHEYNFTVKGASTPVPPTPPQKYKVGDLVEDGTVIDVDSTGEHGLVAYKDDSSTSIGYITFERADSYCRTLNSKDDTMWHLPTIQELGSIHLNRTLVGGMTPNIYWSTSVYCESCQPGGANLPATKYVWAMSTFTNRPDYPDGQRLRWGVEDVADAHCVRSF